MKKQLLLILAIVLVFGSCSNGGPFITGKVDGMASKIYLYEYGGLGTLLVDSCMVAKDNTFTFYKKDKGAGEYAIREDKFIPRDVKRFFVDNVLVTLNGNMGDRREMYMTGNISDSIYHMFRRSGGAMHVDTAINFINRYSNYVASAHIIARHLSIYEPYELVDSLINILSDDVKNTTYGKRAKHINEVKNNTKIGAKFTEIEEVDQNGNLMKLSNVINNNRYTLLTFWASWCGNCKSNVSDMKNIYNKHKESGLGMYSVSMDYEEGEWKEFLKENSIEWVNVSDLRGWECVPADNYFVRTITTTYIIDQNGIIIDKQTKKEELAKYVDQLFKKE